MNNFAYALYIVIIAAIAILTGEIVTFIMLGLILMSLTTLNRTLKEISHKLDNKK